ncbi:hypothetical protein DN730_12805 [Marinomonas piezotolerans]|uniref:Cytochrome c-type biogenesis protein H Ig-like domain-containing protein n=1 Tax=Marinomonas piezotolerans TaxID=2213058 RepID=A0A370U794_9GAMM|nr:hypothetical protein [Marinomonas piezotolerans]RDL43623.1 hypothetical protein DN730_12805 [Marinomonas piezotolerans]
MIIAWLLMAAVTVLSVWYVMHYLVRSANATTSSPTIDFQAIRRQEVIEEREVGRLTSEESDQLLKDARSESESICFHRHVNFNNDIKVARVALSAMIAVVIVGAVALYQKLGFSEETLFTQKMLDQSASEQDVADFLAYRVRRYDRAEDWFYQANNQVLAQEYDAAVSSYRATLARMEGDTDERGEVLVELAQALFYANNNKVSEGMAQVVAQALGVDPNNPKALGLQGMIEFSSQHYESAILVWQNAIKQGADRRQRGDLLSGIEVARKQGGITEQMIPPVVTHKLILQLNLDARLLTSDDVFLVYAQRKGTSLPISIQQVSATQAQLPIVLTNLDNLMSDETLADVDEVNVVVKRSSMRSNDLTQGQVVGQLSSIPSNSEKIFRVNVAL